MAFQEFYCDASTGNNLNSGSDVNAATTTTNGAYTQGGGAGGGTRDRFTAAAGTPFSGRAVGDYASIYNDGAGAPTPYIARITAINAGGASIDVESTKGSGTRATTVASGKTATVGGPWLGPNGATAFPFNFITRAAQDNSTSGQDGNPPRVNFKNNTTYSITAAMTHGNIGLVQFQGYSSSPGDGGKAIIDGGSSGASYILLTVSNTNNIFADLQFQNNGATGSAAGLTFSGNGNFTYRVVVKNMLGFGINANSARLHAIENEVYNCNTSNTASTAGIRVTEAYLFRCYSHDNAGSNNNGFIITGNGNVVLDGCISESNGLHGFFFNNSAASGYNCLLNCDAYNNSAGDGASINNTVTSIYIIANCNFVKNGGWGINGTGSSGRMGFITNCGFGSGGDANSSGTTTGLKDIVESGSITYGTPTNPWKAPTTGDFRLNSGQALNAVTESFTQTDGTNSGTIGYNDIGSAHHRAKAPVICIDGIKL